MNTKVTLSDEFMTLLMSTGIILDYTDDGMVLNNDAEQWMCLEDVLWNILDRRQQDETNV